MMITVNHVHHFPELRELLEEITFTLATKEDLNMISAEVQSVLDQAKLNNSLVASVDLGLKAQAALIVELQAKINALPVNVSLSEEDKAALVEAGTDLATSNTTLQSDIPANTQPTT